MEEVKMITSEDLERSISTLISDTFIEIEGAASDILEEIGKEAVAELEKTSPVYNGTEKTLRNGNKVVYYNKKLKKGDYSRSWRSEVQRSHGSAKLIVSNKKYQLTHLLENGTTTADGTQRTRAQPHIGPASENAVRRALELLGDDE